MLFVCGKFSRPKPSQAAWSSGIAACLLPLFRDGWVSGREGRWIFSIGFFRCFCLCDFMLYLFEQLQTMMVFLKYLIDADREGGEMDFTISTLRDDTLC